MREFGTRLRLLARREGGRPENAATGELVRA